MASDTALVVRSRGQLRTAALLAAVVLLAAVSAASVAVGSVHIALGDVVGALVDPQATDEHVIVRDVRVPRTLVGIAVGAALGVAGALLQGLTRNPLADPGILGFEAGAALAVVAAIFLLGVSSIAGYVWFALAGAAVAGAVVYRWVLPYSAVLGAILILVADVVGRVVASPAEVPVGIVMAAVGVPGTGRAEVHRLSAGHGRRAGAPGRVSRFRVGAAAALRGGTTDRLPARARSRSAPRRAWRPGRG